MAITRSGIYKPQQQQDSSNANLDDDDNNNNNNEQLEPHQQQKVSEYEQTREQRIQENRQRLLKLGILNLSLQFSSILSSSKRTSTKYHQTNNNNNDNNTNTNNNNATPVKSPSFTPRRSSRLQNTPPVTYTEPKVEKLRRVRAIVLEEGAKPEIYTEEHEKLLGNTEMPWTFGVDGRRADGTRVYDQVNGKTCHQCRQKTLGLRTRCSNCSIVQGQFCGDCLFARYGEHVVEANQNPNWICPPCRGICNCSLCRHARGWSPTGPIYRAISKLGFKSVAHYLIATKRTPPDSERSSDAPQSAKRSLPFEGLEVPNDNRPGSKAMFESTEINQQSEKNVLTVVESDPKSASTGRTRKRSEKNDSDACKDAVKVTDSLELKKASVGRPRKKSKKETNNAVDVPATVNGLNTSTVTTSVSNMTQVLRRSARRFKKENDGVIEEFMESSTTTGDEAISTIKNANISDSKDSIARRLRSRNRA